MVTIQSQLEHGVLSAGELRRRLGVSAPTLMRAVHGAGEDVVRIGRGRATRYGLRRNWQGLSGTRFPLLRISATGIAEPAGELVTLASRQTVWMPAETVSSGLPVEIADARPSGFLGRHFAAVHADLRLPARLEDWSGHHVLLAMSRRGEDLPGNLILGDESFARWQELDVTPHSHADYPGLATATMAGHPPGSSAGGERPKFCVYVEGHHRLVKFAVRSTDSAAKRWCDLLVMEALALDVVASHGVAAARTRCVDTASHRFLESDRFDRVGARGRVAVLSLAAASADPADSWARTAAALCRAGRVTDEDARRLRWLDAFGACIGNADRHQFNILFFPDGSRLRLAPAFDQVSTLYAPLADGQVPSGPLALPRSSADTLDVWDEARAAALEFWTMASADARISDEMRGHCDLNARAIRDWIRKSPRN